MDLKEFYPTPESLCDELLSGVDFTQVKSVLEPSAGKGDIADFISKKAERKYCACEVDCIELNPNLAMILRGKNYRVVADDFLAFRTWKHYDLIAMNPPFSNGDKHLLKALEMQQNGGAVACILNAETLRNPYTSSRKALSALLKKYDADIVYERSAFSSAERKTDVEIAVIKVVIPPAPIEESEIFTRLHKAEEIRLTEESCKYLQPICSLEISDFIDRMVGEFNVECAAGLELIKKYIELAPHLMNSLSVEKTTKNAIDYSMLSLRVGDSDRLDVNKYIRAVRYKYWTALFENKKLMNKLTSDVQQQYQEKVNELADYDFSAFNIRQIMAEMNGQIVSGIEAAIMKLFDEMSERHTWIPQTENNIHYFNAWKTNKAHCINGKVILPAYGMFSSWNKDEAFYLYSAIRVLSDIERCLNYLDGNVTLGTDIATVLNAAYNAGQRTKIPCKYFELSLYKKGTMHIKFTNQKLLDRFNIYACQNRSWLPPSYGKASYEEMDTTEQAVVDAFQGKEKYAQIVADARYYLAPVSKSLPLLNA